MGNNPMLRGHAGELIQRTWLPTLLFAVPILGFEVWHGSGSSPPVGTMTVVALFVVPPTWWRATAGAPSVDVGTGALGGALCGALIVLLPMFLVVGTIAVKGPGDGSGDLIKAAGFIVLVVALLIAVPIGAGLGALAAMLQRHDPAGRPS